MAQVRDGEDENVVRDRDGYFRIFDSSAVMKRSIVNKN